jgi:hypothetical protein
MRTRDSGQQHEIITSPCNELSASPYKKNLSRLGLGLLGGGSTLPEAVLESSVDVLEVRHSAGTAVCGNMF